MDRYFEIVDCDKVRGGSNLVIGDIAAGYDEWKKHGFLPKEGIVGHLLGEGRTFEGSIYILECAPGILVPILPNGVREVSSRFFDSKWQENMKKGCASQKEIEKAKSDEMVSSLMNSWGCKEENN